METEKVILIDKDDKAIGKEEKIKVHLEGKLHRAFSILIFNSKGKILLQKRAENKYHSGGLWSNTCCSHPKPDESLYKAAHRRLKEEMGFDCVLKRIFKFHYKEEFDNGLIENEIDHVFVGNYDGEVKPNKREVADYKWISVKKLKRGIEKNPEKYTGWFKILFKKYLGKIFTKDK